MVLRGMLLALIIKPGNHYDQTHPSGTLTAVNSDGDRFYSTQPDSNGRYDLIVGITFAEWKNAISKRVCSEKSSLLNISTSTKHWFNDYHVNDPNTSKNIPTGSNWRHLVGGCP